MLHIKDRIKNLIGGLFIIVLPQKAQAIAQEGFTLSTHKRSIIDRMIVFRMVQDKLTKNDFNALSTYHFNFWSSNNATSFHNNTTDRFKSIFLKHNTDVIDAMENILRHEKSIDTLCEIGTGSGQVLFYLSNRLPGIKKFIGLDLSKNQINKLNISNTEPKIDFICENALSWIKNYGSKNTIFLTNMGVFEYFTQNDIEILLEHISTNLAPCIIVIIEPLAPDHDLKLQTTSKCFGGEYSFSHNYPYMFNNAGFNITYLKEKNIQSHRIIKLCAMTS
ncbi:MAG: SAM-dependent methyltransferase [Desulforhopalus sp.]|jgi:SAM-dependent methyltransferase